MGGARWHTAGRKPLRAHGGRRIVRGMQFLIELDGPVVDVAARYHQAHRRVQAALGLARREAREFWRLFRKGADLAEIVRPTRPGQIDAYARDFEQALLSEDLIDLDVPQPGVSAHLAGLGQIAPCNLIALRPDRRATQRLLDRHELWAWFRSLHLLSQDRSIRASRLAALVEQEDSSVVVAASPAVVLSAREVGATVVGVSNGACTSRRLRQAGADAVVSCLGAFLQEARTPSAELLRAGYRLPRARG